MSAQMSRQKLREKERALARATRVAVRDATHRALGDPPDGDFTLARHADRLPRRRDLVSLVSCMRVRHARTFPWARTAHVGCADLKETARDVARVAGFDSTNTFAVGGRGISDVLFPAPLEVALEGIIGLHFRRPGIMEGWTLNDAAELGEIGCIARLWPEPSVPRSHATGLGDELLDSLRWHIPWPTWPNVSLLGFAVHLEWRARTARAQLGVAVRASFFWSVDGPTARELCFWARPASIQPHTRTNGRLTAVRAPQVGVRESE